MAEKTINEQLAEQVGAGDSKIIAAIFGTLTDENEAKLILAAAPPATVEELSDNGRPQVTVRLSVGDLPILSRITRRSATKLNLVPGRKVFAQIKSVALLA